MRRILVALVLLGSGAALAQPPGGYPETYSIAGDAIVRALWQLNNAGVDAALTGMRYSHGHGGSTFSIPVSWDYPTEEGPATYTGLLEVQPRGMWPLINQFYVSVCQTPDQDDCGLWGTGETGTSVDIWRNKEMGPLLPWSYPDGGYATDNVCYLAKNNDVRYFRTRYEAEPPSGPPRYWNQNEHSNGTVSSNSYTSLGDAESAITNSVEVYCERVGWLPDRLDAFRDGDVWFRNMTPPSLDDVRDGVRVTFIQAFGESARLGVVNEGELVLLEGLSLSPAPLPEEIGAEPPEPGTPGEGGGDIDPGNCEDGWFLTRVVCEIRTQGERLWSFISHDAWVPETSLQQRVEWLRDDAEERMPFMWMTGGSQPWIISQENQLTNDERFHEDIGERCPSWNIDNTSMLVDLLDAVPGGAVDTSGDRSVSFCELEYVVWMHEHGRQWVLAIMYISLGYWFVRRVVGGLVGG